MLPRVQFEQWGGVVVVVVVEEVVIPEDDVVYVGRTTKRATRNFHLCSVSVSFSVFLEQI